MESETHNQQSMKYCKRYLRHRKTNSDVSVFDDEDQEIKTNTELLRVIRQKLRQVNYSLEFERDGFILLNESGYLCKKGTLETIDSHCVIYNIYKQEDRTDSLDQIRIEKEMQKHFGALLAQRKEKHN